MESCLLLTDPEEGWERLSFSYHLATINKLVKLWPHRIEYNEIDEITKKNAVYILFTIVVFPWYIVK